MTTLVVLESMWGWRGLASAGEPAPQWFPINPYNRSGGRLHRLLRADPHVENVWVTNACQTVQRTARDHGTPDAGALARNIATFPNAITRLIVGGKIAGDTFHKALTADAETLTAKLRGATVLHIPHPAWRMWSRDMEMAVALFLDDLQSTTPVARRWHYVGATFQRAPVDDAPFTAWIMQPLKPAGKAT